RDVEGVSDVLRGTKADDPSKIGKFGIGFKSVFAFTSSPEIHSGDEHFQIRNYIRTYGVQPVAVARDETLIIFPFDHSSFIPEDAQNQIAARLAHLDPRTLLFLRCLRRLDYAIEGQTTGSYTRE